MKFKLQIILIAVLCVGMLGAVFSDSKAASDSSGTDVFLHIGEVCNNNNICEAGNGETIINCPSDCKPTFPPGGPIPGQQHLYIVDVAASTTPNTALVRWRTTLIALSSFQWGETPDYEKGSLSEITYKTHHAVFLPDLTVDTLYYFRITAVDTYGRTVAYTGLFLTGSSPDREPPLNVLNARATPLPGAILLTWQNPPNPDFSHVRIMRSTYFYPRHPHDGELVYEASGQSVRDTNVIAGVKYYYTIFSRDIHGNYSSGVLLSATALFPGETPLPFEPGTTTPAYPHEPTIPGGVSTTTLPEYLQKLSIGDFIFIQRGISRIPNERGEIEVVAHEPIVVLLRQFTPTIKNIAINVQDPFNTKHYNSFLLQFDQEGRQYRGEVNPFSRSGKFNFFIRVVDYDARASKDVPGVFLVTALVDDDQLPLDPVSDFLLLIVIITGTGVMYFFFIIFWRRRRRENVEVREIDPHEYAVFALKNFSRGDWLYPVHKHILEKEKINTLPEKEKLRMQKISDHEYEILGTPARYVRSTPSANSEERTDGGYALRDIARGEEITVRNEE